MKRSIYEWCGLAFLSMAIVCVAAWIASYLTSSATVELSFGSATHMFVAEGNIIFCDHPANLKAIDLVKQSIPFDPAPTDAHSWGFPGFQIDYLGFGNDQPIWSIRSSLLLLFVLFLAAGGFSFHRYRVVRRQISIPTPSVT